MTGYIKYITDEEFTKIKGYISELRSPSMRMCLEIMMYLGLRIGEAVILKREDFNNDFSTLTYYPKKKKKPILKTRVLPNFLSQNLKAYYRKYNSHMEDDYLFFSTFSKNKHLQKSTVRFTFVDMRRDLKLDHVYHTCIDGKKLHRISPHTLRHYFLWKMYKTSGNCIITARDIIGHVKTETTARYITSMNSIETEKKLIDKAFN